MAEKVPKYELAEFMASPLADAFAAEIDSEFRLSEECSRFRNRTRSTDRGFSEKFAESFRSWLERRIRETGSGAGTGKGG